MGDGITGMRVDVESTFDAPPERIWDLLTRVSDVPRWSPECVRTGWLGPWHGPEVGARFTGHNRMDSMEWDVTCQIVESERPRRFGWVVLDGTERVDVPSSTWRFELTPLPDGGTAVRQSFEHGPGDSKLRELLRQHPEWPVDAVVAFRRQRLSENMTATLAAMAGSLDLPLAPAAEAG